MAALSAESRHHRARISSIKRCIKAGERPPDDPELIDAQQKLATARLADYVERVLDTFPRPTDEQLDRIAALLRSALKSTAPGVEPGARSRPGDQMSVPPNGVGGDDLQPEPLDAALPD